MSCFCEQNEEKLNMQCEGDPKCSTTGLGYYVRTRDDDQIQYFCYQCRDPLNLLKYIRDLPYCGKITRVFWLNCECDDHEHGIFACGECMQKKNFDPDHN